jgi:ribosomal protein L14E/L6E/L27E
VEIMRGRDRGTFAVVVGLEGDRFVLVADGDRRKIEAPKKKNALHVRPTAKTISDFLNSAEHREQLTNAQLRFVITQFAALSDSSNTEQEGGE